MNRYEIMLGKGVPVLHPQPEVKPGLPLTFKSFTLTSGQVNKFLTWSKKHRCIHSEEKRFQFGFKFFPTHAGTIITVSCICGAKKDLTDIDSLTSTNIDTIMSAENLDQIAILYGITRQGESDSDLKRRIMERLTSHANSCIRYSIVGGE